MSTEVHSETPFPGGLAVSGGSRSGVSEAVVEQAGPRARLPWWLLPPSPLASAVLGLVGATGPELKSALHIGYGGIAALAVSQTAGGILGAAAAGTLRTRLIRPIPMCALGAIALTLVLTVSHLGGLLPIMLAVIGMADTWLDFRRRMAPPTGVPS